MFLRIFKGNTIVQIVILLITIILLWLPAFSLSFPMPAPELITPAYGFTYNLFLHSPVWTITIALILLMGGALLLNTLLTDFGLTPRNSYLSAFIYIMLMSCSTNYLTIHPMLIINIMIMILLRMIFLANQRDDSLKEIFTSGIIAALCSLFAFKSAGLFFTVFLFLIILRIYSWRQWVANLFGFITVYLYVFSWYLFTNQLKPKLYLYKSVIQSIHLYHWSMHLTLYEYILTAIILFLLLTSVISFLFNVSEKLINIRRITLALLWLLITTLASTIFYITNPIFDFLYILLPTSLMVILYLTNLKKSFFAELLIIFILIAIVLSRV